MDDFMKNEAKDIISTAVEKASGATGINIEVWIADLTFGINYRSTLSKNFKA